MPIRFRHYDVERDLRPMCELARASSEATLHAGDVQLKLSDPSLRAECDVRVCEEDEEVVGFAFVQPSCFELNFVVGQCARRPQIEARVMDWALARFDQIAEEQKRRVFFSTSVREHDGRRVRLLKRHGFIADEAHHVYMQRPLDLPIPAPRLPAGFRMRQLAGADELRAYVAARRNAFWMENYTKGWHRRVREMPYYKPGLDLIVIAPGGTLAAFCLSWLEPGGCAADGLTRGYIQTLGTRLKFQKMGLGRALFLETLRRLRALGADVLVGQAEGGNANSLRVAGAAGARPLHKIYRYSRASDAVSESFKRAAV
jgi:GNAT superfamily N-acetyltransferase